MTATLSARRTNGARIADVDAGSSARSAAIGATSKAFTPDGHPLHAPADERATPEVVAPEHLPALDRCSNGPRVGRVEGEPSADPTNYVTTPRRRTSGPQPPSAIAFAAPVRRTPTVEPSEPSHPNAVATSDAVADGWVLLRIWAECHHDCQKNRIALTNRIGRTGTVPPEMFAAMITAAEQAEREAEKALVKTYRKVVPPTIVTWQENTRGIGAPTLARLLGTIGDPLIATPLIAIGKGKDRAVFHNGDPFERTVSQLWRYCGWSPNHRPRQGMSQAEVLGCGKGRAKVLGFLLAEAQVKSRGAYRALYDHAKAAKAESGWTPAHVDAHAKRVVAKAILRDLWRVRKDLPPLVGPTVGAVA